MRKSPWFGLAFALLLLSACVTINVYFPAAAAEEAAHQFIGKVIGEPAPEADKNNAPAPAPEHQQVPAPRTSLLGFLVGNAYAQSANLNIQTPPIQAIQARMAARFASTLEPGYASGAIGLTKDGLVAVHDASKAPLATRNALTQAVADENRDRGAVYREIAVANGHPEWEEQIRDTFAKQWVRQARAGWYYQDAAGAWKQK